MLYYGTIPWRSFLPSATPFHRFYGNRSYWWIFCAKLRTNLLRNVENIAEIQLRTHVKCDCH
jgi:hypothetical protein